MADPQLISIEILGEHPATVPGKVKQITDRSMHLFVTILSTPTLAFGLCSQITTRSKGRSPFETLAAMDS